MRRQVVPTIVIISLPGIYASSIKNFTNFNSSWRLTTAALLRCRTIFKSELPPTKFLLRKS